MHKLRLKNSASEFRQTADNSLKNKTRFERPDDQAKPPKNGFYLAIKGIKSKTRWKKPMLYCSM